MSPPRKAPARLLALLALAAAAVALIVIVSGSLGEDDKGRERGQRNGVQEGNQRSGEGAESPRPPRFYTVREGDTLNEIARRFHVSVLKIERLNPGIDALTLQTEARLKLR